ncbi:hypothetical protein [Actinokineospora bangkokensis]|uniref:Cell division protein FtsL n=1 Tax=Actinokineospora bangkokensis TaxID=1193682 RepID=A0A1Q9LQ64_9PSEU|nr:hypothetical protein [Actinokineospora bangkokensis]OLR94187.1 hypothetical protein BJP25_10345 [Actinokineospora bangkokensis]
MTAPARKTEQAPAAEPVDQPRRPVRRRTTTARRGTAEALQTPRRAAERATAPAEEKAGRTRTAAAERAYARRAQREGRPPAHNSNHRRSTATATTTEATPGRASFVVLVIVVLCAGVAATLWLTTQAIADSYRLEAAKQAVTELSEREAQLQREVSREESASALAERARALGMVPGGDPGHIVVGANGEVTVIGDPTPAATPAPVLSPQEIAAQQQAAQEQAAQEQAARDQAARDQAAQQQANQPAGQTPQGQPAPAAGG